MIGKSRYGRTEKSDLGEIGLDNRTVSTRLGRVETEMGVKVVTVGDARMAFGAFVARTRRERTIQILTKLGDPVAALVPLDLDGNPAVELIVDEIRLLRAGEGT